MACKFFSLVQRLGRVLFVVALGYLCGSLIGALTFKVYADQPRGRVQYVKDVYASLPQIFNYLIHAQMVREEPLDFLKAVEKHLGSPLVFVKDDRAFVITEKEKSRLMRSPEGLGSPIFINESLLNSNKYSLDLPQLVKLFLHELGHKTELADVDRRDEWAQAIELRLRGNSLKSNVLETSAGGEEWVEALTFYKNYVEVPLEHNPFKLQPTFWIYHHKNGEVANRTEEVMDLINNHSLLARGGVGTEITTVITEVLNGLKGMMAEYIPQMQEGMKAKVREETEKLRGNIEKLKGIKIMMEKFGLGNIVKDEDGDELTIDEAIQRLEKGVLLLEESVSGMRETFMKSMGAEHPVKAITVLELLSISLSEGEFFITSSLEFGHSHTRTGTIKANGIPFIDDQGLPVEIRMTAKSAQMSLTPPPQYFFRGEVKKVIRDGGDLRELEVFFMDGGEAPLQVELGLQIPGATLRLKAKKVERKSDATYLAHFELNGDHFRNAIRADRIYIDNEEIQFLDRVVDYNSSVTNQDLEPKQLAGDLVIPESFGLWGFRGDKQVKESEFSHLSPPVYFYMTAPQNPQFVINPLEVWLEFDVRENVDVAQVELFFSSDQMIFNPGPDDKYPVISVPEEHDGKRTIRRYASGGAMVDRKLFRISMAMDRKLEGPSSRPGFKTVRVGTVSPIKHMRDLAEGEVYSLPTVTPVQVHLVTGNQEVYTHIFRSTETPGVMEGHTNKICESMLSSVKGSPGNPSSPD